MYNKRVLFTGKGNSEPTSEVEYCMENIVVMVNRGNTEFFVETCISDVIQNINCRYKRVKGIIVDWERQEIEVYTVKGYEAIGFKIFTTTGVEIISTISDRNIARLSEVILRNIWTASDQDIFFEKVGSFTA